MRALTILLVENAPPNVLEWSFIAVLATMSLAAGLFALAVVARLVEPRGVRALLRRIAGRP